MNENTGPDLTAEYERVTAWFREAIEAKKHSMLVHMAAVDDLRGKYLDKYTVWWESTRRPNGTAGGYVPEDIVRFGEAVKSQQQRLLDYGDGLDEVRQQYLRWSQFRDLGEVEHCPACAYRGLIPARQQRYRHTMCCVVCGHEQTVYDLGPYRTLPHPDR